MVTKSDWDTAYNEILEEGRARLGPPPTAEEVEALWEKKLPPAEAQRVRELLVYYPDMARAMTEPVPTDFTGLITEEEAAAGVARLRERVRRELDPVTVPKPLPAPLPRRQRRPMRRFLAAAAVAGGVLAGTVAYQYATRFEGVPVMLSADGQLAATTRGSGQTPHQLSTETDYLLKPAFRPERDFRAYQVELFDLSAGEVRSIEVWRDVDRAPDGSFPVELSTKGFAEGRYRLVLYGVDERPEQLAAYTIRLTAR